MTYEYILTLVTVIDKYIHLYCCVKIAVVKSCIPIKVTSVSAVI